MSKRKPTKQTPAYLVGERRRQRTIWASVVTVSVLLIAGVVGYSIYASQRSDELAYPKTTLTADRNAIAMGTGPVTVEIYADYLCPACKRFKDASWSTLQNLVQEKKITIAYYPVAILDRASSTRYSTRSASAGACAAEGGKFDEFTQALYAQQPPEGGPGLTDDQMIEAGRSLGLGDQFAECVKEDPYAGWVEHVTDVMAERGVTGTPTVVVDGKRIEEPSPQNLTAAITAAAK